MSLPRKTIDIYKGFKVQVLLKFYFHDVHWSETLDLINEVYLQLHTLKTFYYFKCLEVFPTRASFLFFNFNKQITDQYLVGNFKKFGR